MPVIWMELPEARGGKAGRLRRPAAKARKRVRKRKRCAASAPVHRPWGMWS